MNENEVTMPEATVPLVSEMPDQLPAEIAQAQANARELEQQQAPIQQPAEKEESLIQKLSPKSSADWNELRKAKQAAERERDELRKLLESQKNKEEDDFQIDPNEVPEGKHLVKINQELKKVKKELYETKEEARIRQQQAYEAAVEARLQTEYPDINRILRQENFDALRQKHPMLAASINANPDFYSKAVATYDAIKNLGIAGHTELNDFNENRIKENMAKPRALSAVTPRNDNPLTRANAFANGLTPELQKALQKEMAEAMGNH